MKHSMSRSVQASLFSYTIMSYQCFFFRVFSGSGLFLAMSLFLHLLTVASTRLKEMTTLGSQDRLTIDVMRVAYYFRIKFGHSEFGTDKTSGDKSPHKWSKLALVRLACRPALTPVDHGINISEQQNDNFGALIQADNNKICILLLHEFGTVSIVN